MKHIYVRVDGNEIIATGHVMRCLSIAEKLRQLGAEVIFVVADARPRDLIEQRGFQVDVLHTIWNELEGEIDIFKEYIVNHQVKTLLLDTYYVTENYLKSISQCTNVIYMDDLNRFLYPVHTIVRYNAFVDEEEYKRPYKENGYVNRFLVGSKYVPLREEFSYEPYEVKKNVRRVLITTGGTDKLNVAGNLLNMLLKDDKCRELEYHVIVGCFNQHREELLVLENEYDQVHLHENVTNMSEWMRNCDVAISAAGTTTYELCACGIPSICLSIADNQSAAKQWEQHGYMKYAGNACLDMENCLENCKKSLVEYRDNYKERMETSKRMQSLIDGYGAKRIAEYVVYEMGEVECR